MEFGIDFAETGRMSFLSIFITRNGVKVKRFFGFWMGRFMGFGKFLVGFFCSRFVLVWSRTIFRIYGLIFCMKVCYGLDSFWVLSSYHCKRVFWWKGQTGDKNYQVLVWYVSFPISNVFEL
jgi:hypothetical protein